MAADDVFVAVAATAPAVIEPKLLVSVADGIAVDSIVVVVLYAVDIHIYHVAAFDTAIVVYN